MNAPRFDVDVAIVGGGFSGLALAYRLMTDRPDLTIQLFEASDRLGGKALTETVETEAGRFLVEGGPDSFLAAKPWAKDLAVELGLEDRLLPINRVARPVSIIRDGRAIRMPAGIGLAAPALIKPFVESPLLSPSGRARALREPRLKPSLDDADESVGAFIRRRLGPEMLDWIAEPLMAGIYNGDPDRMSLLATFPQLRVQERNQGGLIRAARMARAKLAGSPRPPAFLTFTNGIGALIAALAGKVAPVARLSSPVCAVDLDPRPVVRFEDGRAVSARQVVLAVPATDAARLLAQSAGEASERLALLRTNPAGSISLAFRDDHIRCPLPGYGLLAPLKEGRPINAVTVASKKFDGRAPEGWTLLRVFFGGARSPETMLLADDELTNVVLRQLTELTGAAGAPLFTRIYRWPSGSPQYDVGHLELLAGIERTMPDGVHLAGGAYRGVGLPDLANEAGKIARAISGLLAADGRNPPSSS